MLSIGLSHYLVVGAVLFCSGLFTMMTKRNAIGILIGVVAAYLLSARLTRPILSLTESALAIRAGNLNAYADISTNDELEQLSRDLHDQHDEDQHHPVSLRY